MKYRIKFKAIDFALSNSLAKANDTEWGDVLALKPKVEEFFKSKEYNLEGDTDYRAIFTEAKPKIGYNFWGVIVNYDEKWIAYTNISKEEDGYYPQSFGHFEDSNILKFFDRLGFEILEEASKDTRQTIADWFGGKYEI